MVEDIPGGSGGDSALIDLYGTSGGADRYSVQFVALDSTPTAKTFDSGESQVAQLTFLTKAATGESDYIVIYAPSGEAYAAAADKTGSGVPPVGVIWTSIPDENKVLVNLAAATTAANVATAFAGALTTLGIGVFSAVANTANVTITMIERNPADAPVPHNTDDTGAGTIVSSVTNAGIASEVIGNVITIPNHGMDTGLVAQLTSTGTLPTGLTTSTNYYVIKVDEDQIMLASSANNAKAGIPITLGSQGSDGAVATMTPTALAGASIKLQKSNDGVNFIDVEAATAISGATNVMIEKSSVSYRYIKAVKAITSGQVSLKAQLVVIGKAT